MGRLTSYNADIANEVCRRLAAGNTLNVVCAADDMPPGSTVRQWALDDRDGFAAKYARARELLFHHLADEMITLADLPRVGQQITRKGEGDAVVVEVITRDMVDRSRLQIDTRKWLLSKLLPRTYGDKVAIQPADTLTLSQLVMMSYQTKPEPKEVLTIAAPVGSWPDE